MNVQNSFTGTLRSKFALEHNQPAFVPRRFEADFRYLTNELATLGLFFHF